MIGGSLFAVAGIAFAFAVIAAIVLGLGVIVSAYLTIFPGTQ